MEIMALKTEKGSNVKMYPTDTVKTTKHSDEISFFDRLWIPISGFVFCHNFIYIIISTHCSCRFNCNMIRMWFIPPHTGYYCLTNISWQDCIIATFPPDVGYSHSVFRRKRLNFNPAHNFKWKSLNISANSRQMKRVFKFEFQTTWTFKFWRFAILLKTTGYIFKYFSH